MSFFGLFVIGAMLIGCGAMLSPAWPTREPRIGLAGTLSLALVMGGAVFWAFLFGWDTLVVDYLLFALVSLVVLGGTFSQGQMRAEERGEELLDKDQGWTGPEDLLFFGLVAILCAVPLIVLNVPLRTEAANLSLITLAVRDGSSFTSLAPYFPNVSVFAEPGFHAISAYLSQQLGQPVPMIHQVMGSVAAFLCVWIAYDIGGELRNKVLGRAFAIAAIVVLGLSGLMINGLYSQLMGVLFGLAFVLYVLRVYREALWLDVIGAGLMLGAILYVHVPMFIAALLGFLLVVLAALVQRATSNQAMRIGGIPLVATLGTAPWVLRHLSDILLDVSNSWDEIGYSFIVILIIAGGFAIFQAIRALPRSIHDLARRGRYVGLGVASVILIVGIVVGNSLQIENQPTRDDLAAWQWIRENTESDALLLTLPDDAWTVPFAERIVLLSGDPAIENRLGNMGVDFVIKLSGDETLTMDRLTPVFEQNESIVYGVEAN